MNEGAYKMLKQIGKGGNGEVWKVGKIIIWIFNWDIGIFCFRQNGKMLKRNVQLK